jgi:hypothetical protein
MMKRRRLNKTHKPASLKAEGEERREKKKQAGQLAEEKGAELLRKKEGGRRLAKAGFGECTQALRPLRSFFRSLRVF